jgi:hypothetical protein
VRRSCGLRREHFGASGPIAFGAGLTRDAYGSDVIAWRVAGGPALAPPLARSAAAG